MCPLGMELLAGRGWCISCPQEGTVWPRKTVRRAARSPVPSAKQHENQGVDPGVTGLWRWGSGVTLELVAKRTGNNQRREERPLVRRDGDVKG